MHGCDSADGDLTAAVLLLDGQWNEFIDLPAERDIMCPNMHVCIWASDQLQCVLLRGPMFGAKVHAKACELSLLTPAQQKVGTEPFAHHRVCQHTRHNHQSAGVARSSADKVAYDASHKDAPLTLDTIHVCTQTQSLHASSGTLYNGTDRVSMPAVVQQTYTVVQTESLHASSGICTVVHAVVQWYRQWYKQWYRQWYKQCYEQ